MGTLACDETPTVVTCVRLKAGFTPVVNRSLTIAEHIDNACEQLTWRFGCTDWLVSTTQTSHGWVTSCILSRYELGEQIIMAVVASEPRETREQSEGYVLGELFQVGHVRS